MSEITKGQRVSIISGHRLGEEGVVIRIWASGFHEVEFDDGTTENFLRDDMSPLSGELVKELAGLVKAGRL